ncbi:MAG: hypothetical protein J7K75_11335 [Desulfuromonas sp.]|nr:hypothetical protein [Desulfuromonas sp.]
MAFNSGQTFKEMIEAAHAVVDDNWLELQGPLEQEMEQQRERMREIAVDWFRAGVSDKVLDDQLEELHQQFMTALVPQSGVDSEVCHKAVEAALNCFWKSLMAGL